jgi:hypothetical protein
VAQLNFYLHPAQRTIHDHLARFKIVAAGRRFGKTVFSVIRCYEEALAQTNARGVELDNSSEVRAGQAKRMALLLTIRARDREGNWITSKDAREDVANSLATGTGGLPDSIARDGRS